VNLAVRVQILDKCSELRIVRCVSKLGRQVPLFQPGTKHDVSVQNLGQGTWVPSENSLAVWALERKITPGWAIQKAKNERKLTIWIRTGDFQLFEVFNRDKENFL